MNKRYLLITILAFTVLSVATLYYTPQVVAQGSGATVTGNARFEGAAPKPTRIDMSSDPNCAKAHPTPAVTDDIVVDKGGGLANVVIYVADGLGDRSFQPPSQPAVIEQEGCMYKPHVVALQTNQKLDVLNNDITTHNIHPLPNNNREWNKTQPHGVSIEETFAREEITIPVKCNIHPWMHGYIAVFKHPYFAVTDKDGNFKLAELPAGTYSIKAWQEKLGSQTQTVKVGDGETKTLEFVFKQQ